MYPTTGRLHAPPTNEGAVHEENKAVAVNSHNGAIAKSTSKAIFKLEPVAKEVVQHNDLKSATKGAGLLELTFGPAGMKPAAKDFVQKNGTNWAWAWQHNDRKSATKGAGLLAHTFGPGGIKPAAKEIVQRQLCASEGHQECYMQHQVCVCAKEIVQMNGTNWAWAWASPRHDSPHPSSWFGFELPIDNNGSQPFAIQILQKNSTKPAAKEVELLANKSATQPVTTEVTRKNATKPAVNQVELLVHSNVSKPAVKEVAHKNAMTLQVALPAHRNGTVPAANEDAAVEVALLAEEDAANEDPTAQLAAKEVVHKNAMQPALKKLAFRVPKNAITFAGKEIMRKNGTKPTVIQVARKNSTARTTENATAAPPQNPIDQKSGLKKVS